MININIGSSSTSTTDDTNTFVPIKSVGASDDEHQIIQKVFQEKIIGSSASFSANIVYVNDMLIGASASDHSIGIGSQHCNI